MTVMMREYPTPASFLPKGNGDLQFPNTANPLCKFLTNTDNAHTVVNQFNIGTPGTIIGAPTFTSTDMACSGNGGTPKGLDAGVTPGTGPILMMVLFTKPTTACGIFLSDVAGSNKVGIGGTSTTASFFNGQTANAATMTFPGGLTTQRLFVAGWGSPGDYPYLVFGQAGVLSVVATGTQFGVARSLSASNIQIARTGGGSGNFNMVFAAAFNRTGQLQDFLNEALITYNEAQSRYSNVF